MGFRQRSRTADFSFHGRDFSSGIEREKLGAFGAEGSLHSLKIVSVNHPGGLAVTHRGAPGGIRAPSKARAEAIVHPIQRARRASLPRHNSQLNAAVLDSSKTAMSHNQMGRHPPCLRK